MLLKIPVEICAKILKVKNAQVALSTMVTLQKFTVSEIAQASGLSKKSARKLLRVLLHAGIIEKRGRAYQCTPALSKSGVMVNLRDLRSKLLFKPNLLHSVLLLLCTYSEIPLTKIAFELGVSYRTVKRLLQRLRLLGLVAGIQVNPSLVQQPVDPLELIPKTEHRLVVREFLQLLPSLPSLTVVFFGDACFGLQTTTLNFLVLFPATIRPEELTSIMERYVVAARSITEAHGFTIDLTFAVKDVWLEQKLGMVIAENTLIKQALCGVCLSGELPDRDDYFELHNSAHPVSPTRLAELLRKGYVKQEANRYVYSEKALQTMRKKAPTLIKEIQVSVLGKNLRLLKIERPEDTI